jgi:hypothetical protein
MIEGSPRAVHLVHSPVNIALAIVVPVCLHGLGRHHNHVESAVLARLRDILEVTPALRLIFPVFLHRADLLWLRAPTSTPVRIEGERSLVELDKTTVNGDEVFARFLCLIVVAADAILETEAEDGAVVEASRCRRPHVRLAVDGVGARRVNCEETHFVTLVLLGFVLV